jgi:hypothetical protein
VSKPWQIEWISREDVLEQKKGEKTSTVAFFGALLFEPLGAIFMT